MDCQLSAPCPSFLAAYLMSNKFTGDVATVEVLRDGEKKDLDIKRVTMGACFISLHSMLSSHDAVFSPHSLCSSLVPCLSSACVHARSFDLRLEVGSQAGSAACRS